MATKTSGKTTSRSDSTKGGSKRVRRRSKKDGIEMTGGSPIIIVGGSFTLESDFPFDYRLDKARKKHIYTCQENKPAKAVRHKDKDGKEKYKHVNKEFTIEFDY